MDENLKRELRKTTLVISLSVAAFALAAISVVLSITTHKSSPWIGVIIGAAMVLNLIPTIKRRKEIKEAMNSTPRL